MKTTVTTIAPVLLPFLFAFSPGAGISSYARDPIERGSYPTSNAPAVEKARQPSTTVSMVSETTTVTKPVWRTVYVEAPRLANWLESAVNKISGYSHLENGWKGEGTLAPTPTTVEEAKELAAQFATEMPSISSPSISADEDGSICFFWLDGTMMANVSVYGDGSYSFYAEGHDDPARSDGEAIGLPLPATLIATMTGPAILNQIAA